MDMEKWNKGIKSEFQYDFLLLLLLSQRKTKGEQQGARM